MNSQATIIVMSSSNSESSPSSQNTSSQLDDQTSSEDDGDAACGYERIQKKLKTSSQVPREHEEERTERESTSCESLSEEGIEKHEIPEFFLSPAVSTHSGTQPKLEEFKLDDNHLNYLSSATDEECFLIKEANEFASKNDGQFLCTGSCLTNSKLKFKCKFNHQFVFVS